MDIKSIGVDIEEISRFSTNKYENKKSFYKKIFSDEEIKYCLSKPNPYPHFTVRFCAKEAVIKALDNPRINLKDIQVVMKNKKPTLVLPNDKHGLLSLSHTKKYAIAFVILI